MYEIGSRYNLITKYNIKYDRRFMLNYACAIRIMQLLQLDDLNEEQKNKLNVILSNLIVL